MTASAPAGEIQKGYVSLADGQIHYRRLKGDGEPIVFLHRTPSSSRSFEPVLRYFAGGRGAVALDTPGFGGSFDPSGDPSTKDYATWLLAAVDGLGIGGFHLCGHHTGTHFAVEICAAAPDRVRSLVLSGVMYAAEKERLERLSRMRPPPRSDMDGGHLAPTWDLVKALFADLGPDGVTAEYLDAVRSLDGRRQAFNAIFRQDFAAVLGALKTPVRIIQPEDDPLDDMLPLVAESHPMIGVERIGRAGLLAPERQTRAFCDAILSFIAGPQPTGAEK